MWLFFLACSIVSEQKTTTTLTDVGTACLASDTIQVDFETCLSSSCDTLVSATCTAELQGDTVVVHAEAVIESEGNECTDDCGFVSAECALPEGADPTSMLLEYAGNQTALGEACPEF